MDRPAEAPPDWCREVAAAARGRVALNEPMSKHTSFAIGGPADLFFVPLDWEDLAECLRITNAHGVPHFILGAGSNLLVADAGMPGMTLVLDEGFKHIVVEGDVVRAGGAAQLPRVANETAKSGLTGLEFAAGIPGTVGGGVYMNAGCYGRCMSDVILDVRILDETVRERVLSRDECRFAYRKSAIQRTSAFQRDWIVLEARMQLAPGNAHDIQQKIDFSRQYRKDTQPLTLPNAGSTFKNPEGHNSWQLIDQAGARGKMRGGAQVSPKHSNFIVNTGGATAQDVWGLVGELQAEVLAATGQHLEPEIIRVGRWPDLEGAP